MPSRNRRAPSSKLHVEELFDVMPTDGRSRYLAELAALRASRPCPAVGCGAVGCSEHDATLAADRGQWLGYPEAG